MTTDAVKLAPSILAADFAHLGDQVAEAKRAGADRIYVDVMDGHFVPNLSMGPPDHLDDALAGTDLFIIHWEGNNDLRTVQRIKKLENASASPLTRRLLRLCRRKSCKTLTKY